MQITQNQDGSKNHIREHWHEWLWIRVADIRRFVEVGSMLPRFYLPVGQERLSGRIDCWILPLAPLAMVYYLANHAFKSVWFDLVELLDILRELAEQKQK